MDLASQFVPAVERRRQKLRISQEELAHRASLFVAPISLAPEQIFSPAAVLNHKILADVHGLDG